MYKGDKEEEIVYNSYILNSMLPFVMCVVHCSNLTCINKFSIYTYLYICICNCVHITTIKYDISDITIVPLIK